MPAWAQSSVTVFDIPDLSARGVNNGGGGSMQSLASGGNATSRVGFRRIVDLGGGPAASFWLEHGMLIDTCADASTAQILDCRSTVSVAT